MRIDVDLLRRQISALELQYPELKEDDEAWAASLDSETDFNEIMNAIVDKMRDASTRAGAAATRIAELEIRQGRYERREQAMRELAFKLMQAAEVRKLELAEATLSVRNGTPKVIITDEAIIPEILCRIKREPDKTKIKELLTKGEPVRGAALSNAEPALAVRTK